tara:strand:- start:111 stop:563 length:453 start_codon:yes stop_codon:yes gene_type:complete
MKTYINFGSCNDPDNRKVNVKDIYLKQVTFPRQDCYPRYIAKSHCLVDCCVTNKITRLNKDHKQFRKEYVAEQKAIKLENKRYLQSKHNKDQLHEWCKTNCNWWYVGEDGYLVSDLPCKCNCLNTDFPCWDCERNTNDPMADFNRLGIFR